MQLSHTDSDGNAKMVDVGNKNITQRIAKATAFIQMKSDTLNMIKNNTSKKGDVLTTAKLAGIMSAKTTYTAIPLCHNISLDVVNISFEYLENGIKIYSEVKATDKTGVEMEALHAVTISALTIYDMAKAVDKGMIISDIMLLEKSGGKSGVYLRN